MLVPIIRRIAFADWRIVANQSVIVAQCQRE